MIDIATQGGISWSRRSCPRHPDVLRDRPVAQGKTEQGVCGLSAPYAGSSQGFGATYTDNIYPSSVRVHQHCMAFGPAAPGLCALYGCLTKAARLNQVFHGLAHKGIAVFSDLSDSCQIGLVAPCIRLSIGLPADYSVASVLCSNSHALSQLTRLGSSANRNNPVQLFARRLKNRRWHLFPWMRASASIAPGKRLRLMRQNVADLSFW